MGKRSKKNPGYAYQGSDNDRLFKASSGHVPGPDCQGCDAAGEVQRDPRDTTDPEVHYGTIASGNTLIKDAAARDRIVADVGEDCICFEMEAAGLMNHFPCLVIRGSATTPIPTRTIDGNATPRPPPLRMLRSSWLQQQINSLQQTTDEMKATTNSISSDLRTDKIKRWLCPPDPSTNAKRARDFRHKGTGVWLLENPVFQEWHSGARRHLWLHGLAGCGKTVLSATVLNHLTKGNDRLILSFFFDFGDATKQAVDGMLRSLAFQLYQKGACSAGLLDALFQAHKEGRDQPATKTFSDVLFKMLTVQKKVSIVLDALDESTTRDKLLSWIKAVISSRELCYVQLICTSRPETEFLRDILSSIGEENHFALDKQAVNADIRSYVIAQLSQRRDFQDKRLSQDLVEQIQKKVGDGADGMFRWAACQLDSLAGCPSPKAIKTALDHLPQDLKETYKRMLCSIPKDLRNSALRLLQFLVHTHRPLTLPEAVEIIATDIEEDPPCFDPDGRVFREEEVLRHCPSLISIVAYGHGRTRTTKELHLAHFSVKEYLLRENQFNITTASISITRTCLTYLTDINGSNEEIKQDFPMARYAAEVWTGYAALAQASEDIARAIVRFLEEEVTFQRWARLYQPDRHWDDNPRPPRPPRASRLYYACCIGLIAPARDLISKGADVNARGGLYGNALQAASNRGHQEIVILFLDKGADVNA
ncbi:hypothetical protein DL769_004971 [Monosporascus sp. CRB-8-3]|nr:hypothetical protein DL769_004971 [Monosporascus sp. CRB-8-3]